MIPSLSETTRSLFGALRLLRGDEGGLLYFDARDEGFWKSFFAALLVAPGLFAFVYLDPRPMTAGPVQIVLVETIAFVIGWTAFPLAMYHVTRAIDREARFRLHIVAYNWSQAIQIVIALPLLLGAERLGVLPKGLTGLLELAVLLGLGFYEWFIARCALNLPRLAAFGIVLLSFMIAILLSEFSYALLR